MEKKIIFQRIWVLCFLPMWHHQITYVCKCVELWPTFCQHLLTTKSQTQNGGRKNEKPSTAQLIHTHTHTLHTAEWCFGIIMPGSGGKLHWSLYWCCSHSGLYFPLWSKHTLTACHYCPPLSIRSHLKLFRCRETTALNSLSACCCQSAASPTPCLLLLK